MKIFPIEAELFHEDRQTDGRTDRQIEKTNMTKLIVTFRNTVKEPKNYFRNYIL